MATTRRTLTVTEDQAGRLARRGDGAATAMALIVWLCTLPFVLLLMVPWFGLRAAVTTALVLLVGIAVICWATCSRTRLPSASPRGDAR